MVPEDLTLSLGDRCYELSERVLVVGILNRTPDSFYDAGETYNLDALVRKALRLADEGADVLEVGGVKAGIGPEVSLDEELDRVMPAIEALHSRIDIPLGVDTWRAEVVKEALSSGAVLANDISGFKDPGYLAAVSRGGGSVVAAHIRLGPRVFDPNPVYDDVVSTVKQYLEGKVAAASSAGITRDRIIIDPGLDLGKSTEQSLALLGASPEFAAMGYPVFLAASNKDFLGELLGLGVKERGDATCSALSVGVILGCRVLRVHDVKSACMIRDTLEALMKESA
ncbi:MAG: dihydropteroate synthase [Actinobacteria bacterium]|nr:dihydropteroate synthase [Actinomycetota bacterium]